MIITKIMGGLGNQMFQYAIGRRLAYERNTILKLDLSWFSNQYKRVYLLDHFNIAAQTATSEEIARITKSNWTGFPRRIFRAIQRRLPNHLRAIVEEETNFFDPHILRIRDNTYLAGYWQSEKYFVSIRPIIQKEFRLRESFLADGQKWARKIQSHNSVSVHIRRGDYISDPLNKKIFVTLPVVYYKQAVEYICDHNSNVKFYIFSDDLPWAYQNLELPSSSEFVYIDDNNRDEQELFLMSLCDHHIIANSSFSWWGAWLGIYPGKIVIAPKQWFVDSTRETCGLIPETWIRI
jgi:hypothetical protein